MIGKINIESPKSNSGGNEELKIVDFSGGTDEEIAKMLQAHYEGKINVSDYWSVGDIRKIHVNAVNNSADYKGGKHSEQDMNFMIIGFDHDDLTTSINNKTKAAITVQAEKIFGSSNGSIENLYILSSSSNTTDENTWEELPVRTWLNTSFFDSLPMTLQPLIKNVDKKCLSTHTQLTTTITSDKIFWLSYPEIKGKLTSFFYLRDSDPKDYEGNQYDYYKIGYQQVYKKINNGNDDYSDWWTRSPAYSEYDGYDPYGYYNGIIDKYGDFTGSDIHGNCPAFCL